MMFPLIIRGAIFAFAGLLFATAGFAEIPEETGDKEAKSLKKIIADNEIYVETAQPGIRLSGYVEASYTYEFAGRLRTAKDSAAGLAGGGSTLRENGDVSPVPSTEAVGSLDTDANDFNFNAYKLVFEKALPDEHDRWAVGFRTDMMFGEDAKILGTTDPAVSGRTIFNSDYYLQQAFVQIRIPVGGGLDLGFGKQIGLLGYEADERPSNMNFSYGLFYYLASNGNDTGISATYHASPYVDVTLRLSDGWDGSDSGFGGIEGFGKAVTGQVLITSPGQNAQLSTAFWYSPDGASQIASPSFAENQTTFLLDCWGSWSPKFADGNLTLAFEATMGGATRATLDSAYLGSVPDNGSTTWWGVALYTKYQFNKWFSLAARGEYLHNDDGQLLVAGAVPGANSTAPFGRSVDTWDWTVTAGFNLWSNVLMRAEYRYFIGQDGYMNGGDQHLIAFDTTYTF